jgi:3-oxoacyl-[acyl-carrier protein] reductase
MLHSWAPHDAEQAWGADVGGPDGLVAELRQAGGHVEHVSADLGEPDAPATLVAAAREAFGHVEADWVTGRTIASDGGWSAR